MCHFKLSVSFFVTPAPTTATGSRIHCSACPPQQFQHNLQANAESNTVTSSAVQEDRAMALLDSNMPPNKIWQHQPVDAFFTKGLMVPGHEIRGMREAASFTPLISLGPHTDAILDCFKMDDAVLLKLHALIKSVRSSCWETVLRSPKWDLTYEQASNLARALLMDIQGAHQKVTLSKEARAALTAQRHDNSCQFKTALRNAWNELDDTVKTITFSHHKSFRHVQNDLCMGCRMLHYQCSKLSAWNAFCWKKHHEEKDNGTMGKTVLQDLVRDENRAEYCNLTDNEKAQLLQEYQEHRETRDKSYWHLNLQMRTGAETILYMTCGSTDLPLHGISFATQGFHEFMSSVMNIDNPDLMSKMEGFAVQGMKEEITQDPKAWMHWAHYWRNVVQRYLVVIEGWPENIPFVNLSTVSSALPDLEMLLDKWKTGEIH
ncbi:hypothetical protein BDR07DRAFT_1481456 [Suillus spraguei]|nr:hypothetical protein BDR07DRAFT_1481456 [Suillus spraguei]